MSSCVWESTKEVAQIVKEIYTKHILGADIFEGITWGDVGHGLFQLVYTIFGVLFTVSIVHIPARILDHYEVSWWIGLPIMVLMLIPMVIVGIWFLVVWSNCDEKRRLRKVLNSDWEDETEK